MKSESDILDKIRKLLRLADRSRGSTENEAKVALAKAQELMTRHNIDSALLRRERGESGGAGFTVNKGKVDLPKTLITRYVEDNYGKLRNRNTRSRRLHSGSYVAGETKGRTIQINRPLPS
jgi:hypothetical protein